MEKAISMAFLGGGSDRQPKALFKSKTSAKPVITKLQTLSNLSVETKIKYFLLKEYFKTRMHSSGMRTIHSSSVYGGRGDREPPPPNRDPQNTDPLDRDPPTPCRNINGFGQM